ncbi:Transposase IS4 [Popillia japonica]|uniref:Transposase IS4 n=1 Tax=Popillia japonica TaxID=7064 RepID=A0AAW1L4A3_POPJA
MISDYNISKSGVDSLDWKCANYSPNRRTTRWPMAVFFAVVNVSRVNAYILYQHYERPKTIIRLEFPKELAKSLCRPHWEGIYPTCKSSDLIIRLSGLLGIDEAPDEQRQPLDRPLEIKKTC